MDLPVPVTEDFADLFRCHYPRVLRALALAGAGQRAEDIAQEAFARTLSHWKRVRAGTNPAGYVFLTAFRLLRRSGLLPELPINDATAAPGSVADTVAVRVDVDRALAAMPPRRRACAILCWFAGSSPTEAAEALGIAPATVRKQLSLAREQLAAVLA